MQRQKWVLQVAWGAAAFSASVAVFSLIMETQKEDDDDEGTPLLTNGEETQQATAPATVTIASINAALNPMHLSFVQRARVQSFWDELSSSIPNDAIPVPVAAAQIQVYAQRYPEEFPLPQMTHALSAITSGIPAVSVPRPVSRRRSTLSLVGNKLFEMAVDTKGGMQDAMHRAVRRYLERALDLFAERLKEAIKDKDMPEYLQTHIDVAVDQFLPDVKVELFRKTKDLFTTTTAPVVPANTPIDAVAPLTFIATMYMLWDQARACILYNLFPYDHSIWKSLKNPLWWAFNFVGLLPYVGQVWWCYLFLLKDKKDEHQLCQFIIGFKTTQFLTLGLGATFLGIMRYIYCTMLGDTCDVYGPLLSPWNTLFFLGQIALVWIAFFYLPYTERPATTVVSPRGAVRSSTYQDMFGNILHMDRGGYLMKLCGYETITFCITMALALAVNMAVTLTWQRQMLMFWIRTLYGLLSFPFLPFKIPVLENVLMHTCRMGYDERGRTVRVRVKMS